MTSMEKKVVRRTVHPYRVTLTGVSAGIGRRLVVRLGGDWVGVREEGRRTWTEAPVASLYRVLLLNAARLGGLEKGRRGVGAERG